MAIIKVQLKLQQVRTKVNIFLCFERAGYMVHGAFNCSTYPETCCCYAQTKEEMTS